jgi:CheY-like chemotaxis protein
VQSTKILVVEDFEDFRRLICSMLEQRDSFQLIQASDGLEGVQKAEEFQPDLILLEISLPKLDGLEVASVRKLASGAKILFCSVESDTDLVRETLSVGALGHVQKDTYPKIPTARC